MSTKNKVMLVHQDKTKPTDRKSLSVGFVLYHKFRNKLGKFTGIVN